MGVEGSDLVAVVWSTFDPYGGGSYEMDALVVDWSHAPVGHDLPPAIVPDVAGNFRGAGEAEDPALGG